MDENKTNLGDKPVGQEENTNIEGMTDKLTAEEGVSEEIIDNTADDGNSAAAEENEPKQDTAEETAEIEPREETAAERKAKNEEFFRKFGMVSLAVLIAAVIVMASYAVLNPVNVVKRAIERSAESYMARESIAKAVSIGNVIDLIDGKSVSVDTEVNISDNSYMPEINGGGISFSFDKDTEKKIAQSKISALYKNTALMDIYSYTDDKEIVIYSPALYEKSIKFGCENILKQYYESPLMAGSDARYDENNDFSIKLFDNSNITEKSDRIITVYKDLSAQLKYYTQIHWSKAMENAMLEKGENEDVKSGKNTLSCKVYTLSLPSDTVNELFIDTMRDTSKATGFDEFMKEYADYMYTSQPMYQYFFESEADLENYMKSSVQQSIANIEKNAKLGDLTVKFYINKGMVVKCDANVNVTVEQSVMDINGNITLNGENNAIDLVNGELVFNSDGSELKFSLSDSSVKNENVIDVSRELNVDDALGNNIKFIANGSYDVSSNQLLASLDKSDSGGDTQGLSLKAKVVPGKETLNADISEFNADIMGVTCSGNAIIDVRPLSEEISVPGSEAVEIFKVDKETVENIMTAVQDKLADVKSKIEGFN